MSPLILTVGSLDSFEPSPNGDTLEFESLKFLPDEFGSVGRPRRPKRPGSTAMAVPRGAVARFRAYLNPSYRIEDIALFGGGRLA